MEGREKHSFIEVPQKHTMVELRCLMVDVKKKVFHHSLHGNTSEQGQIPLSTTMMILQ
jgi:hypothetical protein